jgi:GR25 family glycosyltransferase involved in LPS biosynthesis
MEWASEKTEPVLILEDDAYSFKNIEDEIEIILSSDVKWDIIMLGWINKSDTQEVDDLFLKCDSFILTHAYLINPIGAKRILKFLGEPENHIDIRISEMGRNNIVRVLLSKEKIFYQNGLESQIPKTNKSHENKPRKILRIVNTKRDY